MYTSEYLEDSNFAAHCNVEYDEGGTNGWKKHRRNGQNHHNYMWSRRKFCQMYISVSLLNCGVVWSTTKPRSNIQKVCNKVRSNIDIMKCKIRLRIMLPSYNNCKSQIKTTQPDFGYKKNVRKYSNISFPDTHNIIKTWGCYHKTWNTVKCIILRLTKMRVYYYMTESTNKKDYKN